MELEKGRHTVYSLAYHAVFVVKYRRNVITREMTDYMKELITTILERRDGRLIEMESDADHIHILFSIPPTETPSAVVDTLKTITSRELRRKYHDEICIPINIFGVWKLKLSIYTVKKIVACKTCLPVD